MNDRGTDKSWGILAARPPEFLRAHFGEPSSEATPVS
jgi:hypothetical protein